MSPVLRWEEPPPRARDIWKITALELQQRPGEWACVVEDAERVYANDSAARCLRALGCQVSTREKAGVMSVWARWPEEATSTSAPNGLSLQGEEAV